MDALFPAREEKLSKNKAAERVSQNYSIKRASKGVVFYESS